MLFVRYPACLARSTLVVIKDDVAPTPVTTTSYTSVGCFVDDASRVLSVSAEGSSNDFMTTEVSVNTFKLLVYALHEAEFMGNIQHTFISTATAKEPVVLIQTKFED